MWLTFAEFLEPDVHDDDISDRYAFKIHSQVNGREMFVAQSSLCTVGLCVAVYAPVLCVLRFRTRL